MKASAVMPVVRDLISMGLGTFIAINEELSGRVHPELLALAAALLGVPSIAALFQLSRGKPIPPPAGDTPAPSSPSAPSSSV